ncbi:ABC transporter substrate-binding protein [Kocuria rosea]|uniref:ABC transporter substrate-binding protein n=1 Tax=Kocuria rosea TaxID=1275 RepID=UPI00203DC44D|nr:extracellular solute-binding protein [Kocuria rosea]MCM3689518.1 extracellular solute-binding protein [Kocuria rosea]
MSFRYKSRVLAVGLTTAVALLAGCGAGSRVAEGGGAQQVPCDVEVPEGDTTVNVLAYNSSAIDPFTNTMVSSCTKDGLTVKHDPIDFAGQVQRTQATLAGETGTFDIVETYGFVIPTYAAEEKLMPLDDLFAKYEQQYGLDGLNQEMLDAMSYEGTLYALPMQAQVFVMAYREDVFEDLGLQPPATFAQLREAAETIQQAGMMEHPVALPWLASSDIVTAYDAAMGSLGSDLVDHGAGRPNFDTPVAAQALEELESLKPYMDPQVTTFDQPAVQQQMYNGDAAISIMFSGRMTDLTNPDNSQYADRIGFAAPPAVEEGGKQYSALSVDGWSIPANTKADPDLLFQLMAVSVGQEASEAAVPAAYPAREGVVTPENSPYADAANDAISSAPPAEPYPYTSLISNAITPTVADVLTGKIEPAEGTRRMQDSATRILQDTP